MPTATERLDQEGATAKDRAEAAVDLLQRAISFDDPEVIELALDKVAASVTGRPSPALDGAGIPRASRAEIRRRAKAIIEDRRRAQQRHRAPASPPPAPAGPDPDEARTDFEKRRGSHRDRNPDPDDAAADLEKRRGSRRKEATR